MTGLHSKIVLSFMMTGHTRCLVDGMFGLIKRKFRRSDCFTLPQLAEIVNSSADQNVAQLIPGSDVVWREWDTFLPKFFRPVPGVSKFHHFEFRADAPGVVEVKEWSTSQSEKHTILKVSPEEVTAAGEAPVIPPGGISRARAEYLYKEIRPFVAAPYQDELCPAVLPE